jgi:hypothetical protein
MRALMTKVSGVSGVYAKRMDSLQMRRDVREDNIQKHEKSIEEMK